MGFFGSFYGSGGSGGSSSSPTFPVIANAATAESIRDRIYALIEALTPTHLSGDKFRRYRNELGADFEGWADKNAAGALRRFQVRQIGGTPQPDVSNTDFDGTELTLRISIAYPQNHRAGPTNAMDRDDAIDRDLLAIDNAIGQIARGNFSGAYDCTPLGISDERDRVGSVDFIVITARFYYRRTRS
jgi:hypothetical protein